MSAATVRLYPTLTELQRKKLVEFLGFGDA